MGERFRGVLSRVGSPPKCLALAVFLASRGCWWQGLSQMPGDIASLLVLGVTAC